MNRQHPMPSGRIPKRPTRPTPEDLIAARHKTLPDLIAPELSILFCGINPGLYSAAVGYHFARPGNRFWSTLHRAGITDRLVTPSEGYTLLQYGCGITDLVARSTASADELTTDELIRGRRQLVAKVKRYTPRCLAILGLGAYRKAFEQRHATLGQQAELIGKTLLWVLPNPSGLNAHYQPPELARQFRLLRKYIGVSQGR
jgi:double-stranded uracil-DNA glycosylase